MSSWQYLPLNYFCEYSVALEVCSINILYTLISMSVFWQFESWRSKYQWCHLAWGVLHVRGHKVELSMSLYSNDQKQRCIFIHLLKSGLPLILSPTGKPVPEQWKIQAEVNLISLNAFYHSFPPIQQWNMHKESKTFTFAVISGKWEV